MSTERKVWVGGAGDVVVVGVAEVDASDAGAIFVSAQIVKLRDRVGG